jgi:DNA-directed RNA polymerase subunit RPC12/RpoP
MMFRDLTTIPKREFDSLCPYCKSRAVYLIGAHQAEAAPLGSHPSSQEAYIEEWRCAVCGKSFELS